MIGMKDINVRGRNPICLSLQDLLKLKKTKNTF